MNFRSPIVLLVGASVVSVLATVAPFAWHLHSLPVSSTSAEPWSHFGGYFGGVLGPVFSLLNLLAILYIAIRVTDLQQTNLVTKRLSIDLYNEWNAEAMHQSRIAMNHLVASTANETTYLPTLSEFERTDAERGRHAFRLYHFFEKWAVLAREDQLDRPLMHAALGSRADWWNENFFRPIKERETDVHMQQTLALIESEVFAPVRRSLRS